MLFFLMQEFFFAPLVPEGMKILVARPDHLIIELSFSRRKACKTQLDWFIVGEGEYQNKVLFRKSDPGWSPPDEKMQERRSTIYLTLPPRPDGSPRLEDGQTVTVYHDSNTFCSIVNRRDSYFPARITVPFGSDDGIVITRYD